ncbi:MAG: phosphoenolpyruvate--protein phosphotransferase [Verrucomicrobiae bacterium]|nr:phosphoenolpyruvate--protein phosphotransferase [Verrucomicrobiae bacterium]
MSVHAALGEIVLEGIPVSAGVCQGKILVIGKVQQKIECKKIAPSDSASELRRLQKALIKTRNQISQMQEKVRQEMGNSDASIFDAHILMLEDPLLIEEVTQGIEENNFCAEYAFQEAAEKYIKALSAVEDELLKERVSDLSDVTNRVINNLLGRETETALSNLTEPCIIISQDLAPSTTAMLDKTKVLGFATDVGSKTSHTAILARSLKIPAVVGLRNASRTLVSGQYALLDGFKGLLIINPTDNALFSYGKLIKKRAHLEEKLTDLKQQVAITLDGRRISLFANIERADEAADVINYGGEGVGLFRTEYLFLNKHGIPTEEEQYSAYSEVAETLKPNPVIIRTLDLGGDKFMSGDRTPEINSFLGWRAIRFCLHRQDIFKTQLRAILRASAAGNIRMMYPMISSLEEVFQANKMVEECKQELRAEGASFDENLQIGVMIEIPSAVLSSEFIARHVKFFSIGTNDLIQYTMAVDRLNEKVAYLYQPTNPSILKMIKMTVDSGHRRNIWVGVCGEMAAEPSLVPLLIGLEIDELSVAPAIIPHVKYIIRRIKFSEAKALAQFALESESAADVLLKCQEYAYAVAPELFEMINNNNHNNSNKEKSN